jgi:acyl-CoA synthetase (AMP-forming)/AMP-acid ligase II
VYPDDSRVFRSSFPADEASGFRTGVWQRGVPAYGDEIQLLHETLLHAFARAAKADATTGVTLLHDDPSQAPTHVSYRAIYHQAAAMAKGLLDRGLAAGDRVLLVLPTSIEFVASFFAVQLAGGVPVPSYPPAALERAGSALERLATIARTSTASFCLAPRKLMPLLGQLAVAPGMKDVVAIEDLPAAGDRPSRKLGGQETAFLQFTSGSTGNPKGVVISHANACHNIHAIGQAARIGRGDVVSSWLPLYHDMGLVGTLLFSIYFRLPLVLMSPLAFLARPVRWLRAISDHRCTLSPAPNFAYGLCVKRVAPDERQGLDLSSWRIALNGAEAVNLRTVNDFIAAYARHGFAPTAMLPVYGLAEVTLAASFPAPGSPVHGEVVDRAALARGHALPRPQGPGTTTVVSVGRAVPGHRVEVVDAEGEPLPEREVGHIVVSGPSVMQGYFGNHEATDAVLRGDSLWTGDLGYVAGGELYVTGRAKDVIIVHGRNYYAEDLESVAARVEGVRLGGVVAFSLYDEDEVRDLVVLVCECKIVDDEQARVDLARRIGEEVSRATSVPVDEIVLAERGTIPKTPSGKPQRALTRELYLKDELAPSRTGKLELAVVVARSGAGFLLARARRLFRRRE